MNQVRYLGDPVSRTTVPVEGERHLDGRAIGGESAAHIVEILLGNQAWPACYYNDISD